MKTIYGFLTPAFLATAVSGSSSTSLEEAAAAAAIKWEGRGSFRNIHAARRLGPPGGSGSAGTSTPFTCTSASPQYDLPQIGDLGTTTRASIDGMIDQVDDGLLDSTFGWNGSEYQGFTKMLLYNGGKNKDSATPAIGNATIGYDCSTSKLCVAAYLSNQTYFEGNDCKVVESDGSSWVSIGTGTDENKYKGVTYVKFPGTDRTIGYEACWTIAESVIGSDFNVEIHFDRICTKEGAGGKTTSTGKTSGSGNGAIVCIKGRTCPPPTPRPSNQPSSKPSSDPSSNPSSVPSESAAPSKHPSSQPSVSAVPSTKPSFSPSVSAVPSTNPSSVPSLSAAPSKHPSSPPSVSAEPSTKPSFSPSVSAMPSRHPSSIPSVHPSSNPSADPSSNPSSVPSVSTAPSKHPSSTPSLHPSSIPSADPSSNPSSVPSVSAAPSKLPSSVPSMSAAPSSNPSSVPSLSTAPSKHPSSVPSLHPSSVPSADPSSKPSADPTRKPTPKPSLSPSKSPTGGGVPGGPAPPSACTFVVDDASGSAGYSFPVDVTVRNKDPCIEIEVNNRGPVLGDIRGVFFNLDKGSFQVPNMPNMIEQTTITITSWKVNDGSGGPPSTTNFQYSSTGVFTKIPSNALMNGGGKGGTGGRVYNFAVEIGKEGKSTDDVNSVTFQVCNPGADNKKMLLTRDMVVGDFGIRETSVGAVGSSRTVSIKINHTNTVCPAAQGGSSTSAAVAAIFT